MVDGFKEPILFYVLSGFCVGWVVSFLSSSLGVMFDSVKGNSPKWDM